MQRALLYAPADLGWGWPWYGGYVDLGSREPCKANLREMRGRRITGWRFLPVRAECSLLKKIKTVVCDLLLLAELGALASESPLLPNSVLFWLLSELGKHVI